MRLTNALRPLRGSPVYVDETKMTLLTTNLLSGGAYIETSDGLRYLVMEPVSIIERRIQRGQLMDDMTTEEQATASGIAAAMQMVHQTATDAGWYVDIESGRPKERNFGEVISLMHSELSEALEADRKNLMDDHLPHRPGQEVEFADCIIRILDTCAARGYDIAGAIIEKNRYNRQRADHKMTNRAAAGGKRY